MKGLKLKSKLEGTHKEIADQMAALETIAKQIKATAFVYSKIEYEKQWDWYDDHTEDSLVEGKFYSILIPLVDNYKTSILRNLGYMVEDFRLEGMSKKTRRKQGWEKMRL